MAQGSFFSRCAFLLSGMVTSHAPLRPHGIDRVTQEILANRDAHCCRAERIEALERSDRLDRWRQELIRDDHIP